MLSCVTRVTAAFIGIELHTKQNGVDRHGQKIDHANLPWTEWTTGTRLEARDDR